MIDFTTDRWKRAMAYKGPILSGLQMQELNRQIEERTARLYAEYVASLCADHPHQQG